MASKIDGDGTFNRVANVVRPILTIFFFIMDAIDSGIPFDNSNQWQWHFRSSYLCAILTIIFILNALVVVDFLNCFIQQSM
jgi:hypothetical protein